MQIPNIFKKKTMSNENTAENPAEMPETEVNNPMTDELKMAAAAEASEQMPLEEDPIEKLQNEISEMRDAQLRHFAEFENYKRRTMKERIDMIKSAGADTLVSLLPILDDFDRALKAAANENSPLKDGVLLIHNKMISTLEQRGLKAMNAIDTVFDADLHEAITNIPVEDESKKGLVIDEVEKGYLLNEKVIRYAKVVVGN
jgi:molecular chaperone GrpE